MPQPPAMSAGFVTAMLGDQDTLFERVQAELPPDILATILYSLRLIRNEIGLGEIRIIVTNGTPRDVHASVTMRHYKQSGT